MALNGIDVSSIQPANICDLVPYDFAIVKASGNPKNDKLGYKWNYTNKYMRQQVDTALSKTGCAGLYHFTYGIDAKQEADFFCDHVKDYVGRAILIIDYEGSNALKQGREWVRTFMRRIKERTGVNPMIYASSSVIREQNLVALCQEENCGIWSANYYAGSKAISGYSYGNLKMDIPQSAMWQYTGTGYLSGYSGPLDLDVFYGDEAAWMAYANGDGTYTPPEIGGDGSQNTGTIKKDGLWGVETTRGLQSALGTKVDGIISGQAASDIKAINRGGLESSTWKTGKGGSDVIQAFQKIIGTNPDRYFGVKSCKAFQNWAGTTVDGYISKPSDAVRELQRRINAGTVR